MLGQPGGMAPWGGVEAHLTFGQHPSVLICQTEKWLLTEQEVHGRGPKERSGPGIHPELVSWKDRVLVTEDGGQDHVAASHSAPALPPR